MTVHTLKFRLTVVREKTAEIKPGTPNLEETPKSHKQSLEF